jgi:hypothetical protein
LLVQPKAQVLPPPPTFGIGGRAHRRAYGMGDQNEDRVGRGIGGAGDVELGALGSGVGQDIGVLAPVHQAGAVARNRQLRPDFHQTVHEGFGIARTADKGFSVGDQLRLIRCCAHDFSPLNQFRC